MSESRISVERNDGVATITFDDPENRNAIDHQTANHLAEASATLGADPDVRCIVLTHSGEFFCTGADLTTLSGDSSDVPEIRQLASRLHEAIALLYRSEKPVIGGIDGVAAGAGFGLALVPDLLLLSEDARLEYAYPRIGLTGDCASTYFLPRLVGLRRAQEIALLDEPISPTQALEDGIATEVVDASDFEERLAELAAEISTGPTKALGDLTTLLAGSFETSLETQLARETRAMGEATGTGDYQRGYQAFFSGEDPEFTGE